MLHRVPWIKIIVVLRCWTLATGPPPLVPCVALQNTLSALFAVASGATTGGKNSQPRQHKPASCAAGSNWLGHRWRAQIRHFSIWGALPARRHTRKSLTMGGHADIVERDRERIADRSCPA